jgi:hypothetical protein
VAFNNVDGNVDDGTSDHATVVAVDYRLLQLGHHGRARLQRPWPLAFGGGERGARDDGELSMARRDSLPSAPPAAWRPLVSRAQWTILARALEGFPEVLDDLRVVLTQLSPGVRSALLTNLFSTLKAEEHPTRAVWVALAITGHEVKLCSAAALGRLHALADDVSPGGSVRPLRAED